jgi:hypothetical protein
MDEVMTIDAMVLQEIRRKWPHYTLDTVLDDLRGLSEVLERIEARSGVAVYGTFYTGRDIVRALGRTKGCVG